MITSDLPIKDIEFEADSIIKVIGVGGGGGNAVNYMYHQGIKDVSFLICNTDRQALLKMDVPAKLQLGQKGLGAGGKPERGRELAQESVERIKEALSDGTEMVFITAGMGGGTGTGAAPVVAQVAQEMDILTVGVVTIPFAFEGIRQIRKAMVGIAQLAEHTDALLVINNEKLKQIYPDFDLPNAFNRSDEVVGNAAKAIAEIITIPGYINTDFADVFNTLKGGNMAIMNVGEAEGEERITRAIQNALHSPIVNTTDVRGASRILLNFYCSRQNAIRMAELDQVDRFRESVGEDVEVKWGATYDDSLGDKVKVTLIATGYSVSDLPGLTSALEEAEHTSKEPVRTPNTGTIDTYILQNYGTKEQPEDVKLEINQPKTDEQEQSEDNKEEQPENNKEEQPETEPQTPAEDNKQEETTDDEIRLEEQDSDDDAKRLKNYSDNITDDTILLEEIDLNSQDYDDTPAWMRRQK